MENRTETFAKAKQIIEAVRSDNTEVLLNLIRKDFTEEDYKSLEKLNNSYEKGYLTDNEYITRISVILHERSIERGNPL